MAAETSDDLDLDRITARDHRAGLMAAETSDDLDLDRIADLFESAADVIDRHGWTCGVLFEAFSWTPGVSVCAEGALIVARAGEDPTRVLDVIDDEVAGERLSLLLTELLAARDELGEEQMLWEWNDADGRTREHVTDLFRAAAKDLRA